jgi:nucleotide-binding universal stress UspA family protein
MDMNVLVWLMEGTWPATVDAVRDLADPAAEVTLLHVIDPGVAGVPSGAFAGLMGRGARRGDPGAEIEAAEVVAESRLLAAAVERLDRPAHTATRRGRLERAVVAAAAGADLLIVARDGDLHRVGPRSLGPATRFVVDHAPCAVLLIWPQQPAETQPPPPPRHPPHERRPGPPGPS